jgi:hypothetical protein
MIPGDQVKNTTMLPKELDIMKRKTRATTKAHWMEGGCPGKGQSEIVNPGAYTEEIFDCQQPNFRKASDQDQNRLTSILDLFSLKNWTPKYHPNSSSQGYIPNDATTYT